MISSVGVITSAIQAYHSKNTIFQWLSKSQLRFVKIFTEGMKSFVDTV